MIHAEVIADSLSPQGARITTVVATFPRFILAEVNTHRAFSRNSASSRAIPYKKAVEMLRNRTCVPMKWQKDHSGMQGSEYLDAMEGNRAKEVWLSAMEAAIAHADKLNLELGVTKQLANRLLEPFQYQTAIITATEWENFFALRAHGAAEIHLEELSYQLLNAINNSTPKKLKAGEWHIPFGDRFDEERLRAIIIQSGEELNEKSMMDLKVMIATARCARVSYVNYEGKDDYVADISLHGRLSSQGHWSAFEHCAQAMEFIDTEMEGNFKGFHQYRKNFNDENKKDERLLKGHV